MPAVEQIQHTPVHNSAIKTAKIGVDTILALANHAALLKVKPRTIYEMVAQGRIPYRKPPGSNILRFDLEEIIAWTKAGIAK